MRIFLTVLLFFCLPIFDHVVYGQNFLITPPIPDNSLYISPTNNFEIPKTASKSINVKTTPEEELVLDGIFKIDSTFYVILNNELYKKGDKNQRFEVVDIEMESVTLLTKNKKVVKYVKND